MKKHFSESRTVEEAVATHQQRVDDAIAYYEKYKDTDEFFVRPCPFCGYEEYEEAEPFYGRYGVAECKRCHSLYVNPCPTQDFLNDYYAHAKCNAMLEKIYTERDRKEKSEILDSRVTFLANFIRKMEKDEVSLLELGCSNGSFLRKLRRYLETSGISKTVHLIGVDTNPDAVKSNQDSSIELHYGTAEDFLASYEGTFDIIWHTELIEHIISPYDLCVSARNKLPRGGYMIFTTPNAYALESKSLSYNVPRMLACSILPPMHLNAFSTLNITSFAIRCGFGVVSIETPGTMDVEMLELQKKDLNNDLARSIIALGDDGKELVQELLAATGASSHMRCVLQKL